MSKQLNVRLGDRFHKMVAELSVERNQNARQVVEDALEGLHAAVFAPLEEVRGVKFTETEVLPPTAVPKIRGRKLDVTSPEKGRGKVTIETVEPSRRLAPVIRRQTISKPGWKK